MNAKEFADSLAEAAKAKGRTVQIEESVESWGIFRSYYSPAPNWYDAPMQWLVRSHDGGKRWAFTGIIVRPFGGPDIRRRKRVHARIAVEVYS